MDNIITSITIISKIFNGCLEITGANIPLHMTYSEGFRHPLNSHAETLQNQMTKAQLFSWGTAHHSPTFKGTISVQIQLMNWRKKYQVTEVNKAKGLYLTSAFMDRNQIFSLNLIMHRLLIKKKNKIKGFFYSKCELGKVKKMILKLSSQFLLHTEILCQLSKPSVMFF